MKNLKIYMLVSLLVFTLNIFGQKVEKAFFDGYLKNEPKNYLPEIEYSVKYATSEWFKAQMDEYNIDLEINGLSKGNGYKIIFVSDDPFLVEDVNKEKNLSAGTYSYQGTVKAESNHKIMVLTEKNEIAYELKVKPNLFHARSNGLGTKATEAEANTQCKDIIKSKGAYLKKVYIKELLESYQKTLNDNFGKFNKKVTYKIYKIKPKNFEYDDFNNAADIFTKAVSSEIINIEEISQAIEIWEKCKTEYSPGKKTRISDVNVDELYLNLAQAYLAKEDYENAKINWDLCSTTKGNVGAENDVKEFFAMQIDHFNNYPKSKENFAPKSMVDINTIKNRNLFFNVLLSFQFAETQGQMRILQDYFPLNATNIKQVNSLHYLNEDSQEKLVIRYNEKGAPVYTNYKLIDENKEIKNYNLDFIYNGNQIVSVNLNGSLKYEIKYQNDLISEITYNPGKSKSNTYTLDYTDPNKILIKLKYTIDGVTKESPRYYYVMFNEKGLLKRFLLDVYASGELLYDDKGNLIGNEGENESTGAKYKIIYISEFNDQGLLTRRSINKDSEYYIQREYTLQY